MKLIIERIREKCSKWTFRMLYFKDPFPKDMLTFLRQKGDDGGNGYFIDRSDICDGSEILGRLFCGFSDFPTNRQYRGFIDLNIPSSQEQK